MNKSLLALKIAEKTGKTKKEAEDFLTALQNIIIESLQKDEEITISGFGSFSTRIRHARKGVHPRHPDKIIDVPAVRVPKFKAGKRLKEAIKHIL